MFAKQNLNNMEECNGCELERRIVNKFFGLCVECNNERLHGSKYGKSYSYQRKAPKKQERKKSKKNKSIAWMMANENKPQTKEKSAYELDNEFYKKCFDTFTHSCEECGAKQPETFLDDNGKVAARWRYSHIVPKSIARDLRRELSNINDLCLKCHSKWEGEGKKEMNIYKTNSKRPLLKKYF